MEQEQILSTLNEQLGQTSLSERTISDYVSANLPAEGEEFNFEKHVGILKSLNGNFSKCVADTVKNQVEDFKKNYKPEAKEKPESEKNEDKGIIQTLLDKISRLEDRIALSEKKSQTESLLDKVSAKAASLKVSNEALWKDTVSLVEISENDTVESVLQKAKENYERKLKSYFGNGAAPYGGSAGGSKNIPTSEEQKKAREAFKRKMKSQGRL